MKASGIEKSKFTGDPRYFTARLAQDDHGRAGQLEGEKFSWKCSGTFPAFGEIEQLHAIESSTS